MVCIHTSHREICEWRKHVIKSDVAVATIDRWIGPQISDLTHTWTWPSGASPAIPECDPERKQHAKCTSPRAASTFLRCLRPSGDFLI